MGLGFPDLESGFGLSPNKTSLGLGSNIEPTLFLDQAQPYHWHSLGLSPIASLIPSSNLPKPPPLRDLGSLKRSSGAIGSVSRMLASERIVLVKLRV